MDSAAVLAQLGEMPPTLRALLDSEWALVALFGVFVLEGAMLMYFMPSELIVPGSIVLLGTEALVPVLAIAVLGATLGQYALFLAAKRGGRAYLERKRWFRISPERLDRFDRWFDRWGPIAVPVSNALLFTRGMLTVPAGFAEMDDRQFVLYSAAGTLVFEVALAGLYLAGSSILF
ncbi:DedA family protein [Salinigranum marinum]|uniref:DedA family protein n=1 Tax=Salinigranum marinum TaxID=1515595 RepID=UPI002989D119|nr:VTT domain-containing protein [Salinigranum marinum]